jgi:hypothetical protein
MLPEPTVACPNRPIGNKRRIAATIATLNRSAINFGCLCLNDIPPPLFQKSRCASRAEQKLQLNSVLTGPLVQAHKELPILACKMLEF